MKKASKQIHSGVRALRSNTRRAEMKHDEEPAYDARSSVTVRAIEARFVEIDALTIPVKRW